MAKATITGFNELERMLKKLRSPEKMAIKAVDAASPVLVKSFKAAVNSVVSGDATGSLAASIEATDARQNELGVFSAVRPTGTDSKGVRNGAKLAYLEYGVRSHGQMPRPVRQTAVNNAEAECRRIIQKTIDEEVAKL